MAYFYCFAKGGNLDFADFLQKSFIPSTYSCTYVCAIGYLLLKETQCDQIVGLFFNISPFTARNICLIAYKICQSKLKILPNIKGTLSKCRIFLTLCKSGEISAKSGHTERE